jgi:lipopolysaccharide transport system permease protein
MDIIRYAEQYDELPRTRKIDHWRDTILVLVSRDMKLRYKRSIIGLAWTMLNPLLQLLVIGFVFSNILGQVAPHYASFLFIGLLIWNWFASALVGATSSIVDNRDLIKCPEFPHWILPVVLVISHMIQFLLSFPILFLMLLVEHVHLTQVIFALPLIILLQFILTLSLAYMFATFHVTFRDTQYLLSVILTLAFFFTPVFYEVSTIPEVYQPLFRLNPMAHVLNAYRELLLHGRVPDVLLLLFLYLVSVSLLALGCLIFRKASHRFVEEI